MEKFALPEKILDKDPDIAENVFVAPGAQIMGDVRIKSSASIWYNCVLRGDINRIEIGERTNIQDSTVIHLENDLPCIVGNDVTIGHRALLHACHIEDCVLIGMGAIVLNGAVVKKGAIIGAGAVVKEGTIVPENTLFVGVPAKQVKVLPEDTAEVNREWAKKYVVLAQRHKERFTS